MTAAYITELGPPGVIKVGRLPLPMPGPGEVLVRTEALAVNHVDTFVRSGAYRTTLRFPFIIGRDLVGTVVGPVPPAAGFSVGDRVWCNSLGYDGRQGSFAEYAAVPTNRLYHLPEESGNPEEAVAVLHTAATAHLGLFREAAIRVGETIVVAGAAGGVGSAVAQLAAAAGARVIATARAEDAEWCRSCGAEIVLDYRQPGLYDALATHAPAGVNVFWDNAGQHDLTSTLPIIAPGGRIIVMAGLLANPVLPIGQLYVKDASIRGFAISNASTADLAQAARTINRGLSQGILKARIGAVIPLADSAETHRLQENGARGRTVVLPPAAIDG